MAKQNRFAGIAGGLLDKVMEEGIQLTQEQQASKEEFEAAKRALNEQTSAIENARRESIRAIDERANDKKKAIQNKQKELLEAYHQDLLRLGVKEEDIPLVERDVVKTADSMAKKGLGALGRFGKYISDGLKNGAESR